MFSAPPPPDKPTHPRQMEAMRFDVSNIPSSLLMYRRRAGRFQIVQQQSARVELYYNSYLASLRETTPVYS